MAEYVKKMIPVTSVFVMLVWCCWPYIGAGAGGMDPDGATSLPRISRTALDPPNQPALERDPFRPVEQELPVLPEIAESTGADALESTEFGLAIEELTESWRLSGTYIRGRRRFAMINGQIWEQGVPRELGGEVSLSCVAQRILPDRVIIEHDGRTVEVTYHDVLSN